MAITEQIPSLNINGNVRLAQLAADAKAAFAGYSKADLAEDPDERKEAIKRAEEISRRMKSI